VMTDHSKTGKRAKWLLDVGRVYEIPSFVLSSRQMEWLLNSPFAPG